MPLVAVTRLRLRSWRFVPMLFLAAMRSEREARGAQGNVAVSALREANRTFWTRSVWTDEAKMRAFMFAGAHGKAMRRLAQWCDEASMVHWQQDSAELPSWQEAHRRMELEGRPSRVIHPSEDHKAYRVPAPRV